MTSRFPIRIILETKRKTEQTTVDDTHCKIFKNILVPVPLIREGEVVGGDNSELLV